MTPDRPNLLQTHRNFAQRILERSQLLLGEDSSSAPVAPVLEPQGWLRQALAAQTPELFQQNPLAEEFSTPSTSRLASPVRLFVPGRPLEPQELTPVLEEGAFEEDAEFLLESDAGLDRPSLFDALASAWSGPQFAREELSSQPYSVSRSAPEVEPSARAQTRAPEMTPPEVTPPEPSFTPGAQRSVQAEQPLPNPAWSSSAEFPPRAPIGTAPGASPPSAPEQLGPTRSSDSAPDFSSVLNQDVSSAPAPGEPSLSESVGESAPAALEATRAPTLPQVWGEQMRNLLEAERGQELGIPALSPPPNSPSFLLTQPDVAQVAPASSPPGPPSRREGSRAQPRLPRQVRSTPPRDPSQDRPQNTGQQPESGRVAQPPTSLRVNETPPLEALNSPLERPQSLEVGRLPAAQALPNDLPDTAPYSEAESQELEESGQLQSAEQPRSEPVQQRSSEPSQAQRSPEQIEPPVAELFAPLEMPEVALPAGSLMVEDYRPSRRVTPSPRPRERSSEVSTLFQGKEIKPQSWGERMKEILLEQRGMAAQPAQSAPQSSVPRAAPPVPSATSAVSPAQPARSTPAQPSLPSFAEQARAQGTPTPLSMQTRRFLEPLVGFDPVDVAVYQTPQADALTRSMGADALTVGETVLLPSSAVENDPRTLGLLAHEMTHVAQNRARGRVFVPPAVRPVPLEGLDETRSSIPSAPTWQNQTSVSRGSANVLDADSLNADSLNSGPSEPRAADPAKFEQPSVPNNVFNGSAPQNNPFEEIPALQAESNALSRATLEQGMASERLPALSGPALQTQAPQTQPPLSQAVLRDLLEPSRPLAPTLPGAPTEISPNPVSPLPSGQNRTRTPQEQATWGNLPTPWELQASYAERSPTVASRVASSAASGGFATPLSSPLSPSSEPMQAAAAGRTLPTPSSVADLSPEGPLPSRSTQGQAPQARVPEPDLDRLAQQVYGLLKRRLSAETRRP